MPQADVQDETVAGELVAYDQKLFGNLQSTDPDAVNQRFAERFNRAEDVDDLFNVLEGNSSKNMIGRKVEIHAVAWQPYQSERGIIPNAICQAVDLDTGEVLEFATTSMMLTMFIRKAELIDALPLKVRIVGKRTNSGQTALNFERV